ncbi:MAG: uracil-DNA glycosylase family protein [Acidimicrobiales bacterium]
MTIDFDPGYVKDPWARLVRDYPDETVYPLKDFRVEWGPIFHRGRLDGSAKVLIIGQDPASHEAVCRRILVGEAGQRAQGFLAKLGITTSYVMINTYLYSVYGQSGGERHIDDAAITAYRNRWLDALVTESAIEAIVTFGHLAKEAAGQWKATPTGAASTAPIVSLLHPTYPDSASRAGGPNHITMAEAMKRLCEDWNGGLTELAPVVTPDAAVPLVPYGVTITPAEDATIPALDLPAGMPPWMRSLEAWAVRTGADAGEKRATITVTVPKKARTWPPV